MHIAFGCDASAAILKAELIALAQSLGHTITDCGIGEGEINDYPIYAARAARMVQRGECRFAVVLCGTGIGVSMACNKMTGIRCGLCSDCYSAEMTRAHNDANVLAMGARVIGPELAKRIMTVFLKTEFEGGRHQRRIDLIAGLEGEREAD
ncbi:MAG: ribose 5-phosphate isomerase B [Oscillospiraceae bacterium]|jgi:ribose 5-phosphate isomerase B|nr:ribose 5-phosphate isomerase B [Oscillospiraceae bacterium]